MDVGFRLVVLALDPLLVHGGRFGFREKFLVAQLRRTFERDQCGVCPVTLQVRLAIRCTWRSPIFAALVWPAAGAAAISRANPIALIPAKIPAKRRGVI